MTTTDDVRAATEALMRDIVGLTEEQVRAASLLPGWSRGHLLTHLARSADAMGNLVTSARTGVPIPAYPSPEFRAAGIEDGAGRPVGELLADLAATGERLLADIDTLSPEALNYPIHLGSRDFAAAKLAFLRLREVAVHHVDLGLGFRTQDWPVSFVVPMLDDLAPVLRDNGTQVAELVSDDVGTTWRVAGTGTVLTGPATDLLAWVVGRAHTAALRADAGEIPPGPIWV